MPRTKPPCPTITPRSLRSWGPCYTPYQLRPFGRRPRTIEQVLTLTFGPWFDVSFEHRLWVMARFLENTEPQTLPRGAWRNLRKLTTYYHEPPLWWDSSAITKKMLWTEIPRPLFDHFNNTSLMPLAYIPPAPVATPLRVYAALVNYIRDTFDCPLAPDLPR